MSDGVLTHTLLSLCGIVLFVVLRRASLRLLPTMFVVPSPHHDLHSNSASYFASLLFVLGVFMCFFTRPPIAFESSVVVMEQCRNRSHAVCLCVGSSVLALTHAVASWSCWVGETYSSPKAEDGHTELHVQPSGKTQVGA